MQKDLYFPLPDNETAFYVFINLVINNKFNQHAPADWTERPKKYGPVSATVVTHNEVGERFLLVHNQKDYNMLEMFVSQFALLRTYWEFIDGEVVYPEASKYDVNIPKE